MLAPALRAELCDRLAAAGLPRIETVSFVRGDLVPQMDGAEEVVAGLHRREGTVYAGLVLNERGYERLVATGLEEAHLTLGATESFNERNANQSVEESIAACGRIIERAHADGRRATVTISVAFGCPFEGAVEPGRVVEIAGRLVAADEIVLADTIGVAVPRRVKALVAETAKLSRPVGVHLHDTRGTALPAIRASTGSVTYCWESGAARVVQMDACRPGLAHERLHLPGHGDADRVRGRSRQRSPIALRCPAPGPGRPRPRTGSRTPR